MTTEHHTRVELKARGNAHFSQEEYGQAIACYTQALVGDDEGGAPDKAKWNAAILSNRAFARLKVGTAEAFALAEADCSVVLETEPRNIKALYRRALARSALGHHSAAKLDLEAIIAFEPSNPQANEALDKLRVQVAARTHHGTFNAAFQQQLLDGKVAPLLTPSTDVDGPMRLKSPRQHKSAHSPRHHDRHHHDRAFAEALRQCSLVAHHEAQAHAARDQAVAKAAWDDLQELEKSVTKSTQVRSAQVKRHGQKKNKGQKASSPSAMTRPASSSIKSQTDALWAELLEDEAKTRSVVQTKQKKTHP
ncbi:Aste57867_14441 [Aphanomyces stellatus]|uniref:Aste57867_14441 protein n=1 Tax=Aphanomyces stellatus TaxID=120398 RepID=A0A485L0M1_9STRA|nr:hypothetical protein As57867_014387 [Aphanomyces stellatus]VFT91263.1 Aste57867_14441 [Aphanomyces stellatus]